MKKNKSSFPWWVFIVIIVVFFLINHPSPSHDNSYQYSDKVFSLISSVENEWYDKELKDFAKKNGFELTIEYDDTLKITRRLNSGEQFDAVWLSNSIWMYTLDSSKVRVSNTKSTSINPVVFGVKKSKAEELGFIDKEIFTQDIVDAVSSGKLKFNMSNPITTDSGASAYLGILTTLAGSPEVLTSGMLDNQELKDKLKTFFSGIERSSGDDQYLEDMFINGDFEAVFTYESSIISINQSLSHKNLEPLYALYPKDGVSISDSPIGYIDQKNEKKKEEYEKLVEYLLSKEGQELLSDSGRRTWYGGINNKADSKVFNPKWGINTTTYISPIKFPSTTVIQKALTLYQTALRKPVHVVFCLDYSGSMASGSRYNDLIDSMDYILSDRAMNDLLQFTDDDLVDVIPFSYSANEVWNSTNNLERENVLSKIKSRNPGGGTALYPSVVEALKILNEEDSSKYNTSVIVMTDGEGNIGSFEELKKYYKKSKKVPVYSIQFGDASIEQLNRISDLTNGKVFDGTTNLIDAFMEVRGYN